MMPYPSMRSLIEGQVINNSKRIVNKKENIIGEVCDLLNERNNLLLIKIYSSNKKVLVPFVEEIITCVDLEEGFLIIDPPKGLFEL